MDIPSRTSGILHQLFDRPGLMLIAFLAPEIVVGLAAWEYLFAYKFSNDVNYELQHAERCSWRDILKKLATLKKLETWRKMLATLMKLETWRKVLETLRKKLKNMLDGGSTSLDDGWTMTHGFFALMGGFVLYVDDQRWGTLTPNELLEFVRDRSVESPAITQAEINDRSKSDFFAKCIAILQLVWFVLQFIARRIQKLPVTLLEIDTLGVVVMTFISYFFWLNKPKDARVPYIVRWKGPNAPPSLDSNKGHATLPMTALQIYQLLGYGMPLYGTLSPEDTILRAACTSGMVFGAIHCLAWNFQFPRHAEKILWRVASIGILFTLSFILPMFNRPVEDPSERLPPESIDGQTSRRLPRWLLRWVAVWLAWQSARQSARQNEPGRVHPFVFVGQYYIAARVSIIVLMFLSLRSLPPGAYDTVV
ncbi:hypothetical protein BD769DRAFT_1575587, partial [Suillus cothurnatus]